MGFVIERLEVIGNDKPAAVLTFSDGLNVVAGASDTGKSYVASLIDYAFGASSAPRSIEAAAGYTSVALDIRDRVSGELHRIERQFGSPRATIARVLADGTLAGSRSVAARHAAGAETLSTFLLSLSGFDDAWRIRINARGSLRSISFRDIAYLSVVHEARIIAERPPFVSENPIEHTPRTDVLRLIVTGEPIIGEPVGLEPPVNRDPGGQVDLLRILIAEAEVELGDADHDRERLAAKARNASDLRSRALAAYDAASAELLALESRRAADLKSVREVDTRIAIAAGLEAKFNLLANHYDSDISRLNAMSEAADLLVALPIGVCPVCGASPEHHRADQVADHFDVGDVRAAARSEISKTERLQAELNSVLIGIHADIEGDATELAELRESTLAVDQEIQRRLSPILRSSAEDLRVSDIERDDVTRTELILTRLDALRERLAGLDPGAPEPAPDPVEPARLLSVDLAPLLQEISVLLTAWNMPGAHNVTFSDRSKDLMIDGEDRESHGKGVRALTCAAFILGLLRNSSNHGRPHPGVVVLDSPLVAYREPDPTADDAGRLIAAGVKDAFYGSLADGITGGQVIIFENESPGPGDMARINYVHFSKSAATGRYGFFAAQT